jgi:hypothetical protein
MTTPRYRFSASRVQRSVRRMHVFFSADDKQEYLDLLSQSASKHWCLVSNHAPFVVLAVTSDRPLARFGEAGNLWGCYGVKSRMQNDKKFRDQIESLGEKICQQKI